MFPSSARHFLVFFPVNPPIRSNFTHSRNRKKSQATKFGTARLFYPLFPSLDAHMREVTVSNGPTLTYSGPAKTLFCPQIDSILQEIMSRPPFSKKRLVGGNTNVIEIKLFNMSTGRIVVVARTITQARRKRGIYRTVSTLLGQIKTLADKSLAMKSKHGWLNLRLSPAQLTVAVYLLLLLGHLMRS